MARLFSSGFELQSATAAIEWETISGSPTISTSIKKSGTAALRCNPTSSTSYVQQQVGTTESNLFIRLYLRIETAPAILATIVRIASSTGTPLASIKMNTNRTLELWDEISAVQRGSDSSAIDLNTWVRVEFNLNGTAATITGKIDGTNFATGDGPSASDQAFVRIGVLTATTADIYFDDIAINNSTGTPQKSYPGVGSILHMNPAGAGDNNPTAGTWADINETPLSDANYIELDETTTIGDFTLESYADAGGSWLDTITLVHVGVRERAETVATESWKLRIKSQASGTVLEGTTTEHNDSTWRTNGDVLPRLYTLTSYTDPQGGGAWTPVLLTVAQIGIQPVDAVPDIWVSNMWALVEFTSVDYTTSTSTTQSTSTSSTTSTTISTSSSTSTSSTTTSSSTSSSTTTLGFSTSTSSTTISSSTSTTQSTSTSSTTTSSSTSTTRSTSSSTSTSSTTTSSSTSTTRSTSTSSTTTSSSTSTTQSSTTSTSSTTTSSSTSTTTTLSMTSQQIVFGEEYPLEGEAGISWQTWSDGAAGLPTVVGDSDWGNLQLGTSVSESRSAVYDLTNENLRIFTLTENRYGAGALPEQATLQIRGDSSAFLQDDASPDWTDYASPLTRTWRYVQIREVKQS